MKTAAGVVIVVVLAVSVLVGLLIGGQYIARVDDGKALDLFRVLAQTQDVKIVTQQPNSPISTDTTYQLRIQGKLASGRCIGHNFADPTCIINWIEK